MPDQATRAVLLTRLERPQLPSVLLADLRKDLGRINAQLCVADVALLEFADLIRRDPAVLRESVRRRNHYNLAISTLDIASTLNLSYASHIALLLSRADQLCQRLRQHPTVDPSLRGAAEGDFMRKTAWLIVASYDTSVPCPIPDVILHQHVRKGVVLRFDDFRTGRNEQMHGAAGGSAFARPLSFADVLQCSKTIQDIARDLCRALSGPIDIISESMRIRFRMLPKNRRRAAAAAALSQNFLLDCLEVEQVLSDLAW
jgi:hypothetical protein